MKFLDLLKDRDLAIEQQILNTFPVENRDKWRRSVEDAIEKAGKVWAEKYLPILVGDNEAAFKALNADVQVKRA